MKLSIGSICKQGGRQYNQDYVAASLQKDIACLVVCDGLGSYVGSEIASSLCANRILDDFAHTNSSQSNALRQSLVADYLSNAHDFVTKYKENDSKLASSCTTVATVVTNFETTVFAHIGDSRVYYFRQGKLFHQTLDHSMAQSAVERGEIKLNEIRNHKDQNKLTMVVGSDTIPTPECTTITEPLSIGDWFLLCTDGWWEYVYEEEMEGILKISNSPEDAINRMEKRLAKRAPYNNDNFTALVALVE